RPAGGARGRPPASGVLGPAVPGGNRGGPPARRAAASPGWPRPLSRRSGSETGRAPRGSCGLQPTPAPFFRTRTEARPYDREAHSAKNVSGRGEQNARTAGLAPDTLIGGARLRPVVVPRIEFLVVDRQLTMQQIQLFDSGMTMRRIFGSRLAPYEHADAVFLRIRGEEFAGDARRCLFPFRFSQSARR